MPLSPASRRAPSRTAAPREWRVRSVGRSAWCGQQGQTLLVTLGLPRSNSRITIPSYPLPPTQDIKYTQTVTLSAKGAATAVTATPFPAGRLLGGSIWRISVEAEDIVYAVRWRARAAPAACAP